MTKLEKKRVEENIEQQGKPRNYKHKWDSMDYQKQVDLMSSYKKKDQNVRISTLDFMML